MLLPRVEALVLLSHPQQLLPRRHSPRWELSFGRRTSPSALIDCNSAPGFLGPSANLLGQLIRMGGRVATGRLQLQGLRLQWIIRPQE